MAWPRSELKKLKINKKLKAQTNTENERLANQRTRPILHKHKHEIPQSISNTQAQIHRHVQVLIRPIVAMPDKQVSHKSIEKAINVWEKETIDLNIYGECQDKNWVWLFVV